MTTAIAGQPWIFTGGSGCGGADVPTVRTQRWRHRWKLDPCGWVPKQQVSGDCSHCSQ